MAVPPAATKKTPEGAEAFARFYLTQYSAAAQAGDPALMNGLATAKCQGCAALRKLVEDMRSKGQHIDIDAMKLGASVVSDSQGGAATVNVLAEEVPKKILDRSGNVVANVKGARFDFRVTTQWQQEGWAVTDLRVVT